jgi:uncharacterized membrane protein YphA (DoxX/SURF4 family)
MAKSGGGDKHQQLCVAGMVLLRFFLGAFFLIDSIGKLGAMDLYIRLFSNATLLRGIFVANSAWGGFSAFLVRVVHPHAAMFAWIILLLGALTGLLLIAGFLTRLAALFALAISAFFLCASWAGPGPGHFGDHTAFQTYLTFIVIEIAVLIAAAGRTWGFDALLAKRTKVKLLW